MRYYRPLLLQEINLRLPSVWIRRLRLNRHLPEVDALSRHSHRFAQILYYLSGRGTMRVEGRDYEVGPGSIVLMPARFEHEFRETEGRRPLCLVLDLDWRGSAKRGLQVARLNLAEAATVKHELSALMRLPDPHDKNDRLLVSASVLRILDALWRQFAVLEPRVPQITPLVRKFDRILRETGSGQISVQDLAQRMGMQSDYLNRLFKKATGQTVREYRDTWWIERAKAELGRGTRVGQVSENLGFMDQNYFARWFKKHTGMTPRSFGKRET